MTDELAREIKELIQRNKLDGGDVYTLILAQLKELGHQVERVNERLDGLEEKLTARNDARYVRRDEFEPVKSDLEQIKSALKWLVVAVIGGLITAALNFIINGGLMTP